MVTIYDIAKHCGVSPATVSKALSDATDVGAKTRERIRRAAAEMHYVPDSRAKSLSGSRSWSIGVLCQDGSEMGLRHYFFAAVIEGFKKSVERLGYDIVFISNNVGDMGYSFLEHCRYRKLDGVFIVNANPDEEECRELFGSELPMVMFDYVGENIDGIATDSGMGMKLLYDHLYDLGHRDIVYLHGDPSRYITQARIAALKKAAEERGECFGEQQLIPCAYYSIRSGEQTMTALLNRESRPTAVICSDDYTAIGVLGAIRAAGLRVPEDISVCGYDGIEITQLMYPQLTTIRQDAAVIGQRAADRIIEALRGEGEKKAQQGQLITVDPSLIIGMSSGQCPQ
ncbi:MAG: LacI family transcriptional regulator [Ruminococcaceae bacterium]|nr:LacI family transcriptional regulator [Oscillospiraceae bacterium]